MDERVEKWLTDILISIGEIEFFLKDRPKDFTEYQKDLLLKRAIERNLEIVGEAVNRILKYDPSYLTKIDQSKKIIGLRNQIIHAYDNISDETIWSIIANHLPKLKQEVNLLLKEK
jgi:uncharacterized protein with HEPN domain